MTTPKLARQSIQHYLKTGRYLSPPKDLPKDFFESRQACFVSLHLKNNHELRGCIGTFRPVYKNTAEEIIRNAVAAATQDPRFPPVQPDKLPDIEISVDLLSTPEEITNHFELGDPIPLAVEPKTKGLIVSTKLGQRGLLLPDIKGVNTPQQQLEICYQKGNISHAETVRLETFTVSRHQE